MLINFKYNGVPSYAFAVFNFSQVKDAVLLVMADKKQEKLTMLFTLCNNEWRLDEDLSFLGAESFQQINKALSYIYNICNQPFASGSKNEANFADLCQFFD